MNPVCIGLRRLVNLLLNVQLRIGCFNDRIGKRCQWQEEKKWLEKIIELPLSEAQFYGGPILESRCVRMHLHC